MEAKVRIQGVTLDSEPHAPAELSDLSLGGARLATPVELALDQEIALIPFADFKSSHPLHKPLIFTVVWQTASEMDQGPDNEWDFYGLRHQGSVLEILESWVGHLLLRRHSQEEIVLQRRHHRRLKLPEDVHQRMRATVTHDQSRCDLDVLDVAPGGLLARGDSSLPVGVHLAFSEHLHNSEARLNPQGESFFDAPIYGCIIDSHTHDGSTFYRVSFDPDSEVDEDRILDWATRLGGSFE